MSPSANQTIKTALALIGLVGAGAFTFLRIFGDAENAGKTGNIVAEERPSHVEPIADDSRPTSKTESEPKAAKALAWDDYLRYDPFEGRGAPTEEILALAMGPSPFFAETIAAPTAQGGKPTASPVDKLALSAILGRAEARIAIIDNHPYRTGDFLLDRNGDRLQDAEYGTMRLARIESEKIEIEAAGLRFTLRLSALEQEVVRWNESGKKEAGKAKEK